MTTRLTLNIDVDYVITKLYQYFVEFQVSDVRTEDDCLVFKVKTGGHKLKIRFRPVAYRDTFAGIEVRKVIVDGFLPISGGMVKTALEMFKGVIGKRLPLLKIDDGILYSEAVKSPRLSLNDGRLVGEIFL